MCTRKLSSRPHLMRVRPTTINDSEYASFHQIKHEYIVRVREDSRLIIFLMPRHTHVHYTSWRHNLADPYTQCFDCTVWTLLTSLLHDATTQYADQVW